jgi:hypothetical protein
MVGDYDYLGSIVPSDDLIRRLSLIRDFPLPHRAILLTTSANSGNGNLPPVNNPEPAGSPRCAWMPPKTVDTVFLSRPRFGYLTYPGGPFRAISSAWFHVLTRAHLPRSTLRISKVSTKYHRCTQRGYMKQDYITVYTIGSLSNSTPAAETPEHTPSGFGFRHALVRLLDRFRSCSCSSPFLSAMISVNFRPLPKAKNRCGRNRARPILASEVVGGSAVVWTECSARDGGRNAPAGW